MIVIDGVLYGANGGNEGGYLACVDFETGDILWRDRKAPKGALLLADDRLYLRSEAYFRDRHSRASVLKPATSVSG